jgi:hypothetical protein
MNSKVENTDVKWLYNQLVKGMILNLNWRSLYFIHCHTDHLPKTRVCLCTRRNPYKLQEQMILSSGMWRRVTEDGVSTFLRNVIKHLKATRRHILDYSNFHRHRHENVIIPDQIRKSLNFPTLSLDALRPFVTFLSSSSLSLFTVAQIIVPKRDLIFVLEDSHTKFQIRKCLLGRAAV